MEASESGRVLSGFGMVLSVLRMVLSGFNMVLLVPRVVLFGFSLVLSVFSRVVSALGEGIWGIDGN